MKLYLIITFLCCSLIAMGQGQIKRPQKNIPEFHGQKTKLDIEPKLEISAPDGVINNKGYVDLGLPSGTLWAVTNLGASAPEEEGQMYGWADPIGNIHTDNDSDYPSGTPPMNICGNIQYDAASRNWGHPWSMPDANQVKELINFCKWKRYERNGNNGVLVIGPNNKTIFIPSVPHRSLGHWTGTKWERKELVPSNNGELNCGGHYYSGELKFDKDNPTDLRPYVLWFAYNYSEQGQLGASLFRSSEVHIRPVCKLEYGY